MPNIAQTFSSLTTRQKATGAIIAVLIIVVLYEVISMFGGSSSPTAMAPTPPSMMSANKPGMPMNGNLPGGNAMKPVGPPQPQPTQLLKQTPEMSQRESELMQMQEETQAKYVAALNELQMLRVSLALAEANKELMKSKYDTIVTEKGIVDLLTKPAPQVMPGQYAQGLANQSGGAANPSASPAPSALSQPAEAEYTVVSVSELRWKWGAVIGYQGNLYSVSTGDVLPPDGSIVVAIDRSGVILEKNGVRRKVSLVPII